MVFVGGTTDMTLNAEYMTVQRYLVIELVQKQTFSRLKCFNP